MGLSATEEQATTRSGLPDPATVAPQTKVLGGLNDPGQPRRLISLRILVPLFVFMIVLPAWGFTAYVAAKFAVSERQAAEAAGRSIARASASAIDFRLTSIQAAMATLALSQPLRDGDFERFYPVAQAFADTQGLTIGVAAPDGARLLNTEVPFGTPLSPVSSNVKFREAVDTRTVQFSRVFWGTVTGDWLTTVTMPVIVDGDVKYVLLAGARSVETWGAMLNQIEVPTGWLIGVTDEANMIVARRPLPEAFVGQPITADAAAVLTSAEGGWGTATSRDSTSIYIAYQRLKVAPWTAIVGVPRVAVDGAVRHALWPVVVIGLSVMGLTIVLASLFGRNFHRQMVSIAHAASAFRGGQDTIATGEPTRIEELAQLKTMLEAAATERSSREARLQRLISDKDLLMQEAHHRVKNSLQLVRGILSLQARSAEHPEAKAALKDAANRIVTVADVHRHLYQGSSTTDINVRQYLEELVRDLSVSLLDGAQDRSIVVSATDVMWVSDKVIALGLIATELVTNGIKYGRGRIAIGFVTQPDGASTLMVEDEGDGFPDSVVVDSNSGLGSRLITSLVSAEDGSVEIDRSVTFGRVVVRLAASWRNMERAG